MATASSQETGILLRVNFEDLIKKIEDAGGNAERAIWDAARKSGRILAEELEKETAKATGMQMTARVQCVRDDKGQRVGVVVGFPKGTYDPTNPADVYKAIFANYGTWHRFTAAYEPRGRVKKRNFIGKAKRKAYKKVKAEQKRVLLDILEGLK